MKVVILAGGLGTRIAEETSVRPKPMVDIGEMPILWHIMKIYASHGLTDFIICLGYKGYVIKEFFNNYTLRQASVKYDFANNSVSYLDAISDKWTVSLIETGESTMTGGRIRRVRDHIGDEPFCLTYGDGVSNVDIPAQIAFHKNSGSKATLTAVKPPGRFGAISLDASQTLINNFKEKPEGDGAWINGGFFVCEPSVIDYIEEDKTVWEQEPLIKLAEEGQLSAYRHTGFWQPMDTLRDKQYLEQLWRDGSPPWKSW